MAANKEKSEPRLFGSTDLSFIENDCWQLLDAAPEDLSSGWRLPVLGTSSRQRTIVLRDVDPSARLLIAHTDTRSGKVNQLVREPLASLLFYDTSIRVQLQVTVVTEVQTEGPVADRLWAESDVSSLRGYLAPVAPGTRSDELTVNLPAEFRDELPTRQQLESGRRNFSALIFTVTSIEWLILNRSGNLRALFEYDIAGQVRRSWMAP